MAPGPAGETELENRTGRNLVAYLAEEYPPDPHPLTDVAEAVVSGSLAPGDLLPSVDAG